MSEVYEVILAFSIHNTLVFKSQSSQSDALQTIVMTSDQIQIPDPTDPNF